MENRKRVTGKNGKVICSILVLLILCILMIRGDKNGTMTDPTPTETPQLPREMKNAWIIEAEGTLITVLYDGERLLFRLPQEAQEDISGCVADLTVEQGTVTKLTVKKDMIEAKVLRIGADFIELEGYGILALAQDSKVYRFCQETESKEETEAGTGVSEAEWIDVVVGYTTSAFVLEGETVCAALIKKDVEVATIRVLLQTASYGGYLHETVECSSESRFYLSDGSETTRWFEAGETLNITKELVEQYGGRVYLGTQKAEGRLMLLNVKRAVGTPSYRGTLEITLQGEKLLVVNELPLEEYLYGVLPSEMPESFGEEALKAQAVCARSYACNQLLANRYYRYGAHVDDSMNCQVYQNYGETEAAIRAVKATFGKILKQDDTCITAYYFSCSYGYTSKSTDVWGEDAGSDLEGKAQIVGTVPYDLTQENGFAEFLSSEQEWYDSDSAWFRWETVLGAELDSLILKRLQERQEAVPDCILLKTGENGGEMIFEKRTAETFGTLEDIIVAERSESGLITKLLLVGSEASYLILREYNIRYILAPQNTVYLKNGSTTSNMALLPSAYFTTEKRNSFFLISGGGYGHGVGMSQYGAKYLAEKGENYETILEHFYSSANLAYLY